MNSTAIPDEHEATGKRTRGQGKGSNFFALGRDIWELLWTVETSNRLNLVLTYLVLLAGTGSDHRLTKWSTNACEQYVGIGKPRAKHAIEELIAAGIVKLTANSSRSAPQYELPILPLDAEPIFLPAQAVTGFAGENPIFRCVKETGDALLLRMVIDLYGLVVLDATHGVPISNLRSGSHPDGGVSARRIANVGAHAVWALKEGASQNGGGNWTLIHYVEGKKGAKGDWSHFWDRIALLKQLGAIYYEPWLFDSEALDAEPLMPLDPAGFYAVSERDDGAQLTRLAFDAAQALVSEDRPYVIENADADFFIPLPLHHQNPALRYVARLRVEADTPGRRLAWKRRRTLVEQRTQAYNQLISDIQNASFDKPMRSAAVRAAR
jgi:hypothetical protein